MKKENSNVKKRRISAPDVFLIILVIACIAGAVLRYYTEDTGILPASNPDKEEYIVSFEAKSVKTPLGKYVFSGEKLYDESGSFIGTIGENVTLTPAKLYVIDSEGKYSEVYAGADNGDNSLIDIKGTILTEGHYVDYGFLADSKVYLAPNYEITLHTNKTTLSVKITDISKVEAGNS